MTKTLDKISVQALPKKKNSIDVPRIYLEYATHKKERKEYFFFGSVEKKNIPQQDSTS